MKSWPIKKQKSIFNTIYYSVIRQSCKAITSVDIKYCSVDWIWCILMRCIFFNSFCMWIKVNLNSVQTFYFYYIIYTIKKYLLNFIKIRTLWNIIIIDWMSCKPLIPPIIRLWFDYFWLNEKRKFSWENFLF